MARPLNDTTYLYGLHDPGGEHLMTTAGVPGWVLVTVAIGSDPGDSSPGDDRRFWADYRQLSNQGLGVIVRLNNGYNPAGAIPYESQYDAYAQRCANFVRISKGCNLWIIGNETNHPIEWPGAEWDWIAVPPVPKPGKEGEKITPARYVSAYTKARNRIKALNGHNNDQVLVAAPAPWNNLTVYEGNPNGDWVQYFREIVQRLGPNGCDGITLHTYTHGADPSLVHSTAKVGDPRYSNYYWHFKAFEDFMAALPENMRHLPVYITETNQGDDPWRNENTGWVRETYMAIDRWNQSHSQQIRSLILYRWPQIGTDRWYITGKQGVIDDFRQSLESRFQWTESSIEAELQEIQRAADALQAQMDALAAQFQQLDQLEAGVAAQQQAVSQLTRQAAGIADLYQQLLALEAELDQIELDLTPSGEVAEPEMEDVRDSLPNHPSKVYPPRSLDSIKRIVVHHTGTRSDISPQLIAQFHVNQGFPGIKYHYLIAANGHIYWTQSLDLAISQTNVDGANADGVAVTFAGNFTSTVPTATQLDSAAQLIAWLIYRFRLSSLDIYGRSELDGSDPTQSPGVQWPEGQQYKFTLVGKVQAILDAAGLCDPQEIAALRQRVRELQARIAALEPLAAQVPILQQQVAGLQAQLDQARQDLDVLSAENAALIAENARLWAIIQSMQGGEIQRPAVIDVVDSLAKHPTLVYQNRTEPITAVVIHHTDTPGYFTPEQIADYHVWGTRYDANGNLIKGEWPGIGYHYLIKPDGTIYWTNRRETRSYHAGNANNYSVGVSLIGRFLRRNYDGTPIPPAQQLPTEEQMRSVSHLVAWLMQEYNIRDIQRIVGHKEVSDTTCPGDQWFEGANWRTTLHQRIQQVTQGWNKSIEHILLFWDHTTQWAQTDYQSAQNYIAHFRPTLSFSTADALSARHVTIGGGEAGVSGADEALLRSSGSQVYRLAGANEAETKAMLDALVDANTPYPGAPTRTQELLQEIEDRFQAIHGPAPKPDQWTIPDGWKAAKIVETTLPPETPSRVLVDPTQNKPELDPRRNIDDSIGRMDR